AGHHAHRARPESARGCPARGDGPHAVAPRGRGACAGGDRMSLEVTDLVVEIGGRRVVDGVSFAAADGERFGLIGESGSGKSLTALALLGLLPDGATTSGSIRWNGMELVGMPDRRLAELRGDDI